VHATIRAITADDFASAASPIGQPLADLRAHVLTEDMTEAPTGTEGDVYIGGAGVSRGYLDRPALTAERFVPDPCGPPGGRLYRTGDRAVRQRGGDLEFRGRADTQVKLHGFRIELGEIEHALLDQPGIRAAACLLREDTPGQPRLVAYLVPAAGNPPHPDQVLDSLRQRLPHYMIPAAFITLTALPRTTNGKLDHASLPAPRDLFKRPRLGASARFIDAVEASHSMQPVAAPHAEPAASEALRRRVGER
jgi:acyl-coenzyme A synthetase/AMP-(fatty) acid ligase